MLLYNPSGSESRKTKEEGWVPGRSYTRQTRRQWDSPRNYRTAAKSLQRARFALVAGLWQLVGPAGVPAWQAAVAGYKANAPAGVKMPDSAFTLFMYVNLNRMSSGSAIVFTPPTPIAVPSFTIGAIGLTGGHYGINYVVHINQDQPDWSLQISISYVTSIGITPTREAVNALSKDQPLSDGIQFIDWPTDSPFGVNIAGMARIFFAQAANKNTGQLTSSILRSTIINNP